MRRSCGDGEWWCRDDRCHRNMYLDSMMVAELGKLFFSDCVPLGETQFDTVVVNAELLEELLEEYYVVFHAWVELSDSRIGGGRVDECIDYGRSGGQEILDAGYDAAVVLKGKPHRCVRSSVEHVIAQAVPDCFSLLTGEDHVWEKNFRIKLY